jgi:hypothetical protein
MVRSGDRLGGVCCGAIVIRQELFVPVKPTESVTLTAKLNGPGVVGVPVMAPEEVFSASPGGTLPAMIANLEGPVWPVTTIAELYPVPTSPVLAAQFKPKLGGGGISSGAASIVIRQEELGVPRESVTFTVKVPVVVGVPVMAPVAVLRVRPAGRAPEATEKV